VRVCNYESVVATERLCYVLIMAGHWVSLNVAGFPGWNVDRGGIFWAMRFDRIELAGGVVLLASLLVCLWLFFS
jgi:hypothetical protein